VFPTPFENRDVTIGAVSADPANVSWLNEVRVRGARLRVFDISAATLDPHPEALAGLDLVLLSNADASSLDTEQLAALLQYAQGGGAILLVGGPAWQQTLSPLPANLVPGVLVGTKTVTSLEGLRSLAGAAPTGAPTVVTLLRNPTGAVLAEQSGIPLVVRNQIGAGQVEYLAFDPSLSPISSWDAAPSLISTLVEGVMTGAMQRLSLPSGDDHWSRLQPPPGPVDPTRELIFGSGVTRPALTPLAAVLLLYLLLMSGAVMLAKRARRRRKTMWIGVTLLASLTAAILPSLMAPGNVQHGVLRVIGVVNLDEQAATQPATLYAGLSAPASESVQVTGMRSALPMPVLPLGLPASASSLFTIPNSQTRLQWSLTEGSISTDDIPSVAMTQSRVIELKTSVALQGIVRSHLVLNNMGDIVGTLRNGTGLHLKKLTLLAGQRAEYLPDLGPGQTVNVDVHPAVDLRHHGDEQTLLDIYGQPPLINGAFDGFAGSLQKRIRWALGALPETYVVAADSEIQFFAWTTDNLHVIASSPSGPEQSLVLVHGSLNVGIAPGHFQLSVGTVGAHLMDEIPSKPQYACCAPLPQAVFIGGGGQATFEFDLPISRRATYSHLVVHIYAGGEDPTYTAYTGLAPGAASAFDWQAGRWIALSFRHADTQLRNPERFVSSTGALLVRLRASDASHELTITDPLRDIQLYGTGSS
ncbi:MAG TPA: hypothetical protein VF898_10690, partial [Chloroflexota bacterium]